MGKRGSACFGRLLGRRKKVFEFGIWCVLARAALCGWPLELSSDLEDSDSLFPGSGKAGGGFSSIRLCGALDDFGRGGSGSSILIDFFPFNIGPGMNDFLLSFFDRPW